jgi:hypothetical protein
VNIWTQDLQNTKQSHIIHTIAIWHVIHLEEFYYEGFQVLTAVVMKSSTYWNTMQCSPLKVNQRFGGTYLDLRGPRISHVRNHDGEDGGERFLLNVG